MRGILRINLFLRLLFVGSILMMALVFPVQAAPLALTEYQVKAAFIYNFAKFVEWPEEVMGDGRPFVIGIVGQDPFGNFIDEAITGKRIREKKMTVRRFSRIEEAVDSHILFISGSEEKKMTGLLKGLGRAPILTVSDADRFAGQGGMVQLVMEQNRVRFAVNVSAFERAGLKPSSQLLKLARIVPDGGADKRFPSGEWYSDRSLYDPLKTLYSIQLQKLIRELKAGSPSPVQTDQGGKF